MLRMILGRRWKRWVRLMLLLLCLFLIWEYAQDLLPSFDNMDNSGVKIRKVFDHWGKDETDINWLPTLLAKRTQEIPLVVVEEHYEVLKYWFQAADLGIIPLSKNILIHIDGHVDGAIPFDTDSLPVFRYPQSRQEIHNMMQRNDMFIVIAALTGFVNHVIWIWPSWDVDNHDGAEQNHLTLDIEMGYIEITVPEEMNRHKLDLCACWRPQESDKGTKTNKGIEASWECHRRNFSEIEAQDGPRVRREQCKIHSTGVLEIMGEAVAEKELKKVKLSGQNSGLILDVDEDFFGCWSDMITMEEVGINRKDITLISDIVADLLFSLTAEEEQLADGVYTSLVHFVIRLKARSCDTTNGFQSINKDCLTDIEVSNYLIENIPNIIMFLQNNVGDAVLRFTDPKQVGFYLQSLLLVLNSLSVKQLKVLADLGICFNMSPSSLYFGNNGQFQVCYGDNIPNNTMVTFHLPTEEEIITRTVSLKKILSSLFQRPDLVTVCRSVRDGYTPKQFFNIIESNVLQSIALTYRSVQYENVHFDTSLLGGKIGWSHRSNTLGHRLLQYLSL
ncbi:unnamed protein product [Candidula unifasciata]|uniref:Uncharacterized protein n=1 Tax=Candidula unifasciata TaxID=100452 RepID=A0A8S3ZRA5_9EUPU|nr:unnamed protein product [Candidula unifasciata]